MTTMTILEGDCRDVLKTLPENSVDAIVTDPPYHLTTGKKGGSGSASLNENSPAGRARIGTGFMGMAWDGGDVAFQRETWAWALRVAKPGALLVAFGGTRTFHRLMVAIEDGGWELRDTLCWLYGSGFPKSLDVSKAIDARERFGGSGSVQLRKRDGRATGDVGTNMHTHRSGRNDVNRGEPAEAVESSAARQWEGWGTALKPAWEPIILARKPLEGTVAANVLKWGTGGMNIDACRIDVDDDSYAKNCSGDRGHAGTRDHAQRGATDMKMGGGSAAPLGRWPANVAHDGSDEVLAHFPNSAGAFAPVRGTEPSNATTNVYGPRTRTATHFHGDSGSAARFFYTAKASSFDRNDGCAGLPERPGPEAGGVRTTEPGVHNGYGAPRVNHHPTVKPTDLMRWLVRLVCPLGGLVLDPFLGSGSTLKAAEIEGMRGIGIELDPAYLDIARRRIAADMPLFATGD